MLAQHSMSQFDIPNISLSAICVTCAINMISVTVSGNYAWIVAGRSNTRDAYNRVVLQYADTIFVHSQPNACTMLWRGSDGLKKGREREINLSLHFLIYYNMIQ